MKISDIQIYTNKPKLYEKGNAVMWTDKHISQQLLSVHLNSEIDLASRKMGTIDRTIEWILNHTEKKQLNILDLGCGTGVLTKIILELFNHHLDLLKKQEIMLDHYLRIKNRKVLQFI